MISTNTRQTLRHRLRKTALVVAGLLVAATSMVVATPAQQASAAGCRHYDTTAWWWNVAPPPRSNEPQDSRTWYYADTKTPTSSSTCNDVNLRRSSIAMAATGENPTCAAFRIRFYPGTSYSYARGEQLVCTGIGDAVLYRVPNGTPYRVEATNYVQFHIYD